MNKIAELPTSKGYSNTVLFATLTAKQGHFLHKAAWNYR